nr:MAG TPA: hypothetical protein [Caudoviricetes sp.]
MFRTVNREIYQLNTFFVILSTGMFLDSTFLYGR